MPNKIGISLHEIFVKGILWKIQFSFFALNTGVQVC
jgi:hypothetical protein